MHTGFLLLLLLGFQAGHADDTRGASPQLQDLQSDLRNVRARAALVLGQRADRSAVEPLIDLLDDPQARVRRAAAQALAMLRDRRAVPQLIIALEDRDANVRFHAAFALGEIKHPQAQQALLQTLRDPEWTVRDQAAWALRELHDPGLVKPLLDMVRQAQVDLSIALWLLEQLGPDHAIDALTELLEMDDERTRVRAVHVLSDMQDPRRVYPLELALQDSATAVRLAAANGLAAIGDKKLRTILEERLRDERDAAVSQALEQAILQLSPRGQLAGWWSFDDGDPKVARDVTGHGSDGEIRGAESVEGRIGAGLRCGEGRYVELGQPSRLIIANQPFTVTAWARSEADHGVVVARGGAFCGFSLYLKDGVPKFGIQRVQDGPTCIAAGDQRVVGRWVHLAGVVHADRIELYVDARLAATARSAGLIPSNCGQGMEIGFDVSNSPAEITDAFQGVLDEVKFFHAALSAADIAEVKE